MFQNMLTLENFLLLKNEIEVEKGAFLLCVKKATRKDFENCTENQLPTILHLRCFCVSPVSIAVNFISLTTSVCGKASVLQGDGRCARGFEMGE